MYNNIDENITVKERGWVGHFICGHRCIYHRNTLISASDGRKIVVSTIGKYKPVSTKVSLHLVNGFESIGGGQVEGNRYYETAISYACFERGYYEYSPDEVIDNDSLLEYQEKISRIDPSFRDSDGHADEYHDKIIQIVINLLKENVL